jgi:hypothetical protein
MRKAGRKSYLINSVLCPLFDVRILDWGLNGGGESVGKCDEDDKVHDEEDDDDSEPSSGTRKSTIITHMDKS